MQTARHRKLGTTLLLTSLLFLTTLPISAQDRDRSDNRRGNQNYYNGMRDGGRGGNYDRGQRNNYSENDARYHQPGGIGPGKGAAIGAASGAVLGALFGGGLRGVVIGGAAGAGVGAVAGQANQNNRRNDNRRDNY